MSPFDPTDTRNNNIPQILLNTPNIQNKNNNNINKQLPSLSNDDDMTMNNNNSIPIMLSKKNTLQTSVLPINTKTKKTQIINEKNDNNIASNFDNNNNETPKPNIKNEIKLSSSPPPSFVASLKDFKKDILFEMNEVCFIIY